MTCNLRHGIGLRHPVLASLFEFVTISIVLFARDVFFWHRFDELRDIWMTRWIWHSLMTLCVRCSQICSVLQCVAVCCSVLQCVAVCCSVLQCVAVCCLS